MSVSYCSAPDELTRFFVRPDVSFACVVGRPEHVQLVYRTVSYVAIGDWLNLPPVETSLYALRAQRLGQPDLVLREGDLLSFDGKQLVRLCGLGVPYWRKLRERHCFNTELPDATDYLLTYLRLESIDPAATDELRERAIWLDGSTAYF